MLKDHIQKSGITQREWAQRFGVTEAYLSTVISGKKLPSLALAIRIERATGGAVPANSWHSSDAA